MSNPRGAVFAEVFFLLATDVDGNRLTYGSYDSQELALADFPATPPVVLWDETYPEYGSRAFVEYGNDDLIAWESRHLDMELYGYDDYLAVA